MTTSTEIAKCPRASSWLRPCRFEARFDSKPTGQAGELRGMTAEQMMKILCTMTYVRDVCVRCGKTIERDPGSFPFTKAVQG